MVECRPSKPFVAGSNPVARSGNYMKKLFFLLLFGCSSYKYEYVKSDDTKLKLDIDVNNYTFKLFMEKNLDLENGNVIKCKNFLTTTHNDKDFEMVIY